MHPSHHKDYHHLNILCHKKKIENTQTSIFTKLTNLNYMKKLRRDAIILLYLSRWLKIYRNLRTTLSSRDLLWLHQHMPAHRALPKSKGPCKRQWPDMGATDKYWPVDMVSYPQTKSTAFTASWCFSNFFPTAQKWYVPWYSTNGMDPIVTVRSSPNFHMQFCGSKGLFEARQHRNKCQTPAVWWMKNLSYTTTAQW